MEPMDVDTEFIMGFDILPSHSPKSKRAPRFSCVIFRNDLVLNEYSEITRGALIRLVNDIQPKWLCTDNIFEIVPDSKSLFRFVEKIPPETRIVQVTGIPPKQTALKTLARRYNLSLRGKPSPLEAARICAELAALGVGYSIECFSEQTEIKVTRGRKMGRGGQSANRYRRKLHSEIQQMTRHIEGVLKESEIDYEEEDDTEDEIREYATNEKGITTKINNFIGIFTWNNNATIDGTSRDVLTSDLDIDDYDENEQKLYLTYSRGSHIYHDPKVGIAGILRFKNIIDDPFFLIFLIAIISSLSISIGYAVYRYRERIFSSQYTELELKKDTSGILGKIKYDSERLGALFDNKRLLHQLEDFSSNKMSNIEDIKVTALSEDFFKVINIFDWEEDDLIDFTREMIALPPEERDAVFKEMINKSEQQKKNRVDDTKRLYT